MSSRTLAEASQLSRRTSHLLLYNDGAFKNKKIAERQQAEQYKWFSTHKKNPHDCGFFLRWTLS
jgi:hypothetical protein